MENACELAGVTVRAGLTTVASHINPAVANSPLLFARDSGCGHIQDGRWGRKVESSSQAQRRAGQVIHE